MIIEIALGIVLAVIILAYLPEILAMGAILFVLALVVLLVFLVIVFWDKVEVVASALASGALLFGLPYYLKTELSNRYPAIKSLLEINSVRAIIAHPGQALLGLLVGIGIASSGIAALFGGVMMLDQFGVLK